MELLERRGWLARKVDRPLFAVGEPAAPGAFAFTLLSGLVVWAAFALSPLSAPVLGGKTRSATQLHNRNTPLAVARFLQGSPPRGLVWAPEDWGDWLAWDGPSGLQVVANSNLSVLPQRVWYDIAQVARAEGNWTRTLDRYGVELLIVDKERQPRLAEAALGQSGDWTVQFEDAAAIVLKRKEA